ncbi:MAG: ThuA domain-containing protein [Gemmataceae bacterium]
MAPETEDSVKTNKPRPGPVFGPDWWAGDAIVCGESRGKLFRTKLVKTAHGYVAQNNIIACLQMLTIDACVSPQGDLVVACHSGPPDWGTGPAGKGKLFKIRYADKKAPQPALAWAQGPREVRIAFDKPLAVEQLERLKKDTVKIEYGKYVRPGDRFETLKPPYAVVAKHWATPRHWLDIHSVQVTPDRRTLILQTAPLPEATSYAVMLPWPRTKTKGEIAQQETVDVAFDLSGVLASFKTASFEWEGWLPHAAIGVSQKLTSQSADHANLWTKTRKKDSALLIDLQLELNNLIHPAVQEGAELDHEWPSERVRVRFVGDALVPTPVQRDLRMAHDDDGSVFCPITPRAGRRFAFQWRGVSQPDVPNTLSYESDADTGHTRSFPLQRFILPFAPTKTETTKTETTKTETTKTETAVVKRDIPQLKDGNWLAGKALFFSEKTQCSACHTLHGAGGKIGPDLSNLIHRDYDSVLRDIRFPSAAINPDHLAYSVMLDDGRSLTGTLRTKDADTLLVGLAEGKEIEVPRKSVETLTPLPISIMPEGIDKKLTPEEMRDLLTFLLTEPLLPAVIPNPGAPKPRSRKEADPFLKREPAKGKLRPLNIVLSSSKQDHGPGEHDYPLWRRRWLALLSMAEAVNVDTADGWPSAKQWEKADLIVFNSSNPGWSADKGKIIDDYLARGAGLVYLHFGVNGGKAPDAFAQRIGLAWGPKARYRHGPLELTFADPDHPITKGFKKTKFVDESYWQLTGDEKNIHLLASAVEEKKARPLLWTKEAGKGRIYVNILGHYTWTFDDPLFRVLLLRGMAWAAGERDDRFLDLATIGARLE